jgi:hypothetical protein
MSREDSVQDIINQLESLQLRQKVLITRLGQLASVDRSNPLPTAPVATRQFEIGDALLPTAPIVVRQFEVGNKVRITNPRFFQEDTGEIVRVGATRITVLTPSGSKIIRAHKHLTSE